jgi:hypothetical protein
MLDNTDAKRRESRSVELTKNNIPFFVLRSTSGCFSYDQPGQALVARGTPMNDRSTNPGARVSVDTFRDDPMYPRVARSVDKLLARGKVVAPVDVLVDMGLLDPKRLEDWRCGRIPYLEKVIHCNLTRLSRLLRILRFHAHDLKLKPSVTAYMRWGKGPKRRVRFTKTGNPRLEEAYARHFVWPGKGPFHPPVSRKMPARGIDTEQEVELGLAKERDA